MAIDNGKLMQHIIGGFVNKFNIIYKFCYPFDLITWLLIVERCDKPYHRRLEQVVLFFFRKHNLVYQLIKILFRESLRDFDGPIAAGVLDHPVIVGWRRLHSSSILSDSSCGMKLSR